MIFKKRNNKIFVGFINIKVKKRHQYFRGLKLKTPYKSTKMGKKCRYNIDDGVLILCIDETIRNPQFEKWNSLSVSFFIFGACLNRSVDVRSKCIFMLKKYLEWRYEKQICFFFDFYDYYYPEGGTELMKSKQSIEKILTFIIRINSNYNYDLCEEYFDELSKNL